jgi:hypothetical protein
MMVNGWFCVIYFVCDLTIALLGIVLFTRIAVLREVERRNEKFARDLDKASSDIIDGEFSAAAE